MDETEKARRAPEAETDHVTAHVKMPGWANESTVALPVTQQADREDVGTVGP